jgi:hypothetical protein
MESRKHSGTVSPEEAAELEELVFDLVRERLLKAVGAGGMWTLQFRGKSDTDSLFGEAISEFIARDIATQIAGPVASTETATVVAESVPVVQPEITFSPAFAIEPAIEFFPTVEVAPPAEVDAEIEVDAEVEVPVEAEVEAAPEVTAPESALEQAERHFHRIFKPRRAA